MHQEQVHGKEDRRVVVHDQFVIFEVPTKRSLHLNFLGDDDVANDGGGDERSTVGDGHQHDRQRLKHGGNVKIEHDHPRGGACDEKRKPEHHQGPATERPNSFKSSGVNHDLFARFVKHDDHSAGFGVANHPKDDGVEGKVGTSVAKQSDESQRKC